MGDQIPPTVNSNNTGIGVVVGIFVVLLIIGIVVAIVLVVRNRGPGVSEDNQIQCAGLGIESTDDPETCNDNTIKAALDLKKCKDAGLSEGCTPAEIEKAGECVIFGLPPICSDEELSAAKAEQDALLARQADCGLLGIDPNDPSVCFDQAIEDAKKMCGDANVDIMDGNCTVLMRDCLELGIAPADCNEDNLNDRRLCNDAGLAPEECVEGDPAFELAKAEEEARKEEERAAAEAQRLHDEECVMNGLEAGCSDEDLEIAKRPKPTDVLECPPGTLDLGGNECENNYTGKRTKRWQLIADTNNRRGVFSIASKITVDPPFLPAFKRCPVGHDEFNSNTCFKCSGLTWRKDTANKRCVQIGNCLGSDFRDGDFCYSCKADGHDGARSGGGHDCTEIIQKVNVKRCPSGFDVCGDTCIPVGEECE